MLHSKILLLLFIVIIGSEAETRRTPARLLAKQTGATQFEEERYETHADCNDHKHHLKKRASDEDVDYEVYQGVVGRPGIDFPIYPRIPRTSFSCKSFGNGYFADMETDCQVFHICEEGRKISFLCPNGTIFQQSELTCDWWFKVNCLGSSGYYAESSELLNKQRVQRIRPAVPVQGFNIVGGGLNIKPKVPNTIQSRSKQNGKIPERRIDSNESPPSVETVDFDDISGEKQSKIPENRIGNSIDNNNNDETQLTAESGSLAEAGRRHNNLQHESAESKRKEPYTNTPSPAKINYASRGSYTSESIEHARQGHRGNQRYKDETKKPAFSTDRNISEESKEHKSLALPEKIVKPIVVDQDPNQHYTYTKPVTQNSQTTTNSYTSGTYSTARKVELTRSTPYYTPTVPPVNKQKTTQGKITYIKGNSNFGTSATTPNSNRLSAVQIIETTLRPIVLGMRHYTESPQSHEYLPTSSPRTTAPTYLPDSRSPPQTERSAAGESLLFAPSPVTEESVSRNLDEMLKVMNTIQTKFEHAEKSTAGTDQLHSLAQYYAGESANSLYGTGSHKPFKSTGGNEQKLENKAAQAASDATASISTPVATVNVSVKADDIKASLLSEKTVTKYADLFGIQHSSTKQQTVQNNSQVVSEQTNIKNASKFPHIGSTDATISQLAEKPESRNIAQVFSNALTTYLEDPKTFREQLASVRPTEPTTISSANFVTVKPTDSSVFNQGTAASYLPTSATTLADATTTQASIAAEINNKFDSSTPSYVDLLSTIDPTDAITNKDSQESTERKNKLELSAEFYPPSGDSNESDEILKQEQSNSFVKPRNKEDVKKASSTEKPWKVSEHDFLDPLTINDGLMKTTKSTTASPITYISIATTTRAPAITSQQYSVKTNAHYESHSSESSDTWQEIFNHYEIPTETLPSNSGLQRIANKLFGGLNETEALHLKNIMQQAEHNRQVLSLLLLLIQTCDDQNGRALERSRKHLLNALIDMDSKLQVKKPFEGSKYLPTTTERAVTTTYKPQPTTTTTEPVSSTTNSIEETTKFEIRVEDPEEDENVLGAETTATTTAKTADKRALELLKSLYSLASKFTSRR